MERRALDDLFLESGLKPPEAEIETTSTALMVAMVMGSDHLSFLPQELVYWEQDGGRLVALPVSGVGWQRGFGITRRRARPQSAAEDAVTAGAVRGRARASTGCLPAEEADAHRLSPTARARHPAATSIRGGVRP